MDLMGRYAAANHELIHAHVVRALRLDLVHERQQAAAVHAGLGGRVDVRLPHGAHCRSLGYGPHFFHGKALASHAEQRDAALRPSALVGRLLDLVAIPERAVRSRAGVLRSRGWCASAA
jgi:hypothetical protein